MTRKNFLIGISTVALAAGTASAQNTNTTDANGNTEVVQCTVGTGNFCDVDNQFPGNDRNFGFVGASGTGNTLTVTQRGDDNSATVEANGTSNVGRVNQTGDDHIADIDMTGRNTAFIDQNEEDNRATIVQVTTATTAAAANFSGIAQGTALGSAGTPGAVGGNPGENNAATVNQNGTRLSSTIEQAAAAAGDASADNNSATVTQTGTGSSSIVRQRSSGNIARVNLSQGGQNLGVPSVNAAGNSRNNSFINQTNTVLVDNTATTATGDFTAGTPSAANNPNGNNNADVALAGLQNSSTVQQNGVNNLARVSMLGGGTGNTEATADLTNPANVGPNGTSLPANRREGNTSDINQVGQNLTYRASIGGVNPANGQNGRGNVANVGQGSTGTLGSGHTTFMFQRGTLDTANVTQNNNALGGSAGTDQQGSSIANVAQASFGSTATVTQTGTNEARVSQGLNADGSGGQNGLTITQVDLGDATSGGSAPTDPFGGGGTTPTTTASRNFANIAQFGTGNTATVAQTAFNASATVFQRRNSNDATVTINQGTGAGFGTGAGGVVGTAAINVTALVRQGGTGVVNLRQDGTNLTAEVNQNNFEDPAVADTTAGETNPLAQISQVGRGNSALVTQEGFNTSATVDQRFTNTGTLVNTVQITQRGGGTDGGNYATARQGTAGGSGASTSTGPATGPAGDADARPAGARSAEIMIMQTNTATATAGGDNSATVEQRGAGQYARIVQNGSNNLGGILQEAAATNAVAILDQQGRGNTFFITQDQAGQFLRVQQNGTTNNVIVGSGPASAPPGGVGGTGTTAPPVFTTTP
jgi:hypothetical protein